MVDIEGNEYKEDGHVFLGNFLFRIADNVTEHELGIKIFHEGDNGTEINEEEEGIIKKYIPSIKYIYQLALLKALS